LATSLPSRRAIDLPALFVLLSALMTAAGRLQDTDWTRHLGLSYGAAALGLLIGVALGVSRFQRRGVLWLAGLYSGLVILWLLSTIISGDMTWLARCSSVLNRITLALVQFSNNEAVDDPVLFLTWMLSLYWLTGLLAGYFYVRHTSLMWMLAPGGLLVTLITIYDAFHPERIWLVGLYLFLAVLLFGRLDYINNRAKWENKGFSVDPETNNDITLGVTVAALVVVLIAWNVPLNITPSATVYDTWRELTRPFNRTLERLSDIFAPLSGSSATVSDFYASTLALGLGIPLSDQVTFTVDIPPEVYDQPRFYWRGRVYDQYTNGLWQTSAFEKDNIAPIENDLPIPEHATGTLAIFNITTYIPSQRLLYAPAQPVWVNRPIAAEFFPVNATEKDVIVLRATRALDPGDNYQTRAAILNPPISKLRSAGTNYPEWVSARYLQLPENFSERVASLASSITLGLDTPYDKATAITQFLHENITYAERVDNLPPPSADILEWFLFDAKQGFCNYYATAEVLMLRAVGIPARLAVGYAQGEPSVNRTRYFVRQKDAHAWPEVYFPTIGWVEFEPTANQSPIVRPVSPPNITLEQDPNPGAQALPTPTPSSEEVATESSEAESASAQHLNVAGLVSGLIAIMALGALLLFRNSKPVVVFNQQAPLLVRSFMERYKFPVPRWIEKWVAWNDLTPVEQAFDAVNHALRHLADAPLPRSATPSERCEALKPLLPKTSPEIEALLREHQINLYSPHTADVARARRASNKIKWVVLRIRIAKYFS